MELRGIFHCQVMDGDVVGVEDVHEMGSVVLVGEEFFYVQNADQPPMIAPTIDFTSSVEIKVG